MKIGCCTNMIATGHDGTGIEFVEKLAKMGFDYIELPLAEMTALSDEKFLALTRRVEQSGIRCETCNNFFPKTTRLTGPAVDEKEILTYAEFALARAQILGVEYVVFGSGGAKNVPDGFPIEKGYKQVVALLKKIEPIARKNNIVIVIEPLRRVECNLINTFAEGCRLARDVDRDNVKVLVDFYHLSQEGEPAQNLLDDGKQYLRHVHFARNEGRTYPANLSEDAYQPFFDALKAIGYNQRISLEACSTNFNCEAPTALQFFRQQFNNYGIGVGGK